MLHFLKKFTLAMQSHMELSVSLEEPIMPPNFSAEFITKLEREPVEVRQAYLRMLSFEENLDFALAVATRLDDLASRYSVSILEGLEQRLETDSSSRQVADGVLAKLRAD